MDLYFVLCIVVFFAIGIVMIIFAFQGPACIDFDESHYEEISREEQHSHQNLNLSMPLPQTNTEHDIVDAVSLTSPYPPKPPPLGFGRILAERSEGHNSYPHDEDVCRMPFSAAMSSFSYVDPPPNFHKQSYHPSQSYASEMPPLTRSTHCPSVSTQTSGASYTRNEPPPPYTEDTGHSQPLVPTRRNRFKKRLSQ